MVALGGSIIPFLIQWMALSTFSSKNYNNNYYQNQQNEYSSSSAGYSPSYVSDSISNDNSVVNHGNYQYNVAGYSNSYAAYTPTSASFVPKTRWQLLNDFQSFTEDEIETFLPQICNILIDRDNACGSSGTDNAYSSGDYGLYENFEKLLIEKCAGCLPFGIRVCGLLKSASSNPSESVLRNVMYNTNTQQRNDRLRMLSENIEYVTAQGIGIPPRTSYLRSNYYRDINFMLETLARIGKELKSFPFNQRNNHLRVAIEQFNNVLYHRMLTRGQQVSTNDIMHLGQRHFSIPAQHVAKICPQAAAYSLHLPLQHCKEKVLRILRFVESECEVLPSKERCPYLVVVELLEQDFECKSDELYTQGQFFDMSSGKLTNGPTVDAIEGKKTDEVHEENKNENVELFARNDEENDKILRDIRGGNTYDSTPPPPPPPPGYTHDPRYQSHHYNDHNHGMAAPAYSQQPMNEVYSQQPMNQQPHYYHDGGMNNPSNGNYAPLAMRKTFIKSRTWDEKQSFIRSNSVFGHLPGWKLKSFIVKSGDDLRKELLAMQLIEYCQDIFKAEGIDISLRPYQIICTGNMAGLVEFLEGAKSIDRIKKSSPDMPSLKDYFEFAYGMPYSLLYHKAMNNFIKSLAGYSLITYLLQVKDRHNANIMIDEDGSIIHIDFGFILGDSPGFNLNFENAPFKLTREYVDLLGGLDSDGFKKFEDLFLKGFYALRKHLAGIIAIVQLFYGDKRKGAADGVRARLSFASSPTDVLSLIRDSLDNWRTKQYDWLQQAQNNIAS